MKNAVIGILLSAMILVFCGCSSNNTVICKNLSLKKQQHLAKLALRSFSSKKSVTYVEKLTDQNLLASVAMESTVPQIGLLAVNKLTDQNLLAKVAMESTVPQVGLLAVNKLTDQNLLAYIAKVNDYPSIRQAAVQKLTDQSLITKIFIEDTSEIVCMTAFKTLIDQTLIKQVLLGNNGINDRIICKVWESGIAKVIDQRLLADIAMNSIFDFCRDYAVMKLSDQELLAEIAIESPHNKTRAQSVQNLFDEELLADVAQKSLYDATRALAIQKLTDQKLIEKCAKEDKSSFVRNEAIFKLTNQTLLDEISKLDSDSNIRMNAQLIIKLSKELKYSSRDLINLFIRGFSSVPESKRVEVLESIYPAFLVLIDHDVADVVGDITSFKVAYSEKSQLYTRTGDNSKKEYRVYGEAISCSVKLSNITDSLFCKWESYFRPSIAYPDFISASVDLEELFVTRENTCNILQSLPQSVLMRIAETKKFSSARRAAVVNLTDQKLLAKYALTNEVFGIYDWGIREAAIKALYDQETLVKFITYNLYYLPYDDEQRLRNLRDLAAKKLTDQTLLVHLAKNDRDDDVRMNAIHYIYDQNILAEIAIKEEKYGGSVKRVAVARLSDQKLLFEVYKKSEEWLRFIVIEKLTDQDILAEIAIMDDSEDIKEFTVARLSDQKLLFEVISKSKIPKIRASAVEKLTDLTLLHEIAQNDIDDYICESAKKRINELNKNK